MEDLKKISKNNSIDIFSQMVTEFSFLLKEDYSILVVLLDILHLLCLPLSPIKFWLKSNSGNKKTPENTKIKSINYQKNSMKKSPDYI